MTENAIVNKNADKFEQYIANLDDGKEQWKTSGRCSLCRRQPYCGNPCQAAKTLMSNLASIMGGEAFIKAMNDRKLNSITNANSGKPDSLSQEGGALATEGANFRD